MTSNEPPAQHKQIFKVLFFTKDDPKTEGTIQIGDAIEHEGHFWLVPIWLEAKEEAWSAPMRLVCLSAPPAAAHFEKMEADHADYLLNYPIPIADFLNEDPPETDHGFVVIERPSLKLLRPH